MTQRPPGTTTTRDVRMNVGDYRVTEILGEGASSIVYAAVDKTGREVALKVLKPDLALSAKEQRRFLDEAERLRRVKHPSLVEVVDSGALPEGAFIAMARLPGTTLNDRLQRAPIRFDVTLTLFEQLADALSVIHAAGLVHRDIKPENILISDDDRRALLLDLGIARDVSADPSTTTRAGMIRGTPAYMAPERFFGKPATPQTDIYELGVVLYFTLVGALPWSSFDNPTERLRPAQPSEKGVVLPPRLSTTLMRALSAESEKRPQTAREFGAAVADALSPESVQLIAGHHTARGAAPPLASGVRTATVPMTATPMIASRAPPFAPPSSGQTPPSGPAGWPANAPPPPSVAEAARQRPPSTFPHGAIAAFAVLVLAGIMTMGFLVYARRPAKVARPPARDPIASSPGPVDFAATKDDLVLLETAHLLDLPKPRRVAAGSPEACVALTELYCGPAALRVQPKLCSALSLKIQALNDGTPAGALKMVAYCVRRIALHNRTPP